MPRRLPRVGPFRVQNIIEEMDQRVPIQQEARLGPPVHALLGLDGLEDHTGGRPGPPVILALASVERARRIGTHQRAVFLDEMDSRHPGVRCGHGEGRVVLVRGDQTSAGYFRQDLPLGCRHGDGEPRKGNLTDYGERIKGDFHRSRHFELPRVS